MISANKSSEQNHNSSETVFGTCVICLCLYHLIAFDVPQARGPGCTVTSILAQHKTDYSPNTKSIKSPLK